MEITTGIRSILSTTGIYELFNALIGAGKSRREFVARYVRPRPGDRILDIGCGPAEVLEFLGDVEYVGFDANEHYIAAARRKFGQKATLFCERLTAETTARFSGFDVVLALGTLHHLDDDEVIALLNLAKGALSEGGRFVTIDPCYREGQSGIARYLIDRDRGQNVRTEERYRALAQTVFPSVVSASEESLTRIPYTHAILVASVGEPA